MKDHIDKLIVEYRQKVADCETVIEKLEHSKKEYRKSGNLTVAEQCRLESVVKYAQKQAYIQAIHDIGSLLDHL